MFYGVQSLSGGDECFDVFRVEGGDGEAFEVGVVEVRIAAHPETVAAAARRASWTFTPLTSCLATIFRQAWCI